VIALLMRLGAGHWLAPWKSPYLRWRIETYWGLHAEQITPAQFRTFVWEHRTELWRYFRWALKMQRSLSR
jgi:hypothetical protein